MLYIDMVYKELLGLYKVDEINLDYRAMIRNNHIMGIVGRMSPDFIVLEERLSDAIKSQFIAKFWYNIPIEEL